jgi:hypothetical protein
MTQQVSPAVIVIVLILLIAVMVALYFLVATEKQENNAAVGTLKPGHHGPTAAPLEKPLESAPPTNTLAPAPGG